MNLAAIAVLAVCIEYKKLSIDRGVGFLLVDETDGVGDRAQIFPGESVHKAAVVLAHT